MESGFGGISERHAAHLVGKCRTVKVTGNGSPTDNAGSPPSPGKGDGSTPVLWWVSHADDTVRHTGISALFAQHATVELLDTRVLQSMIEPIGRLPDVLVADYDYPDLNALRLLREVRERFPLLPIVIFTLQHSEALAVWALRNRVWDYFVKPLPKEEVNRIVVALLNWHRLRQAGRDSGQFLGSPYPDEIKLSSASALRFDVSLAVNYLQTHCSSTIGEQDVADIYGMSRFRFSREFKKATGKTFKDYVISYRMTMARSLLERPGVLIADVAAVVGFSDPAYFSRVFKKTFGSTPSVHRTPRAIAACPSDLDEEDVAESCNGRVHSGLNVPHSRDCIEAHC